MSVPPMSEETPSEDEGPSESSSPWERSLKLGAFLNQSAAVNEEDSRDGTINSTSDRISYRLSLDGELNWKEGPYELQQELSLRLWPS